MDGAGGSVSQGEAGCPLPRIRRLVRVHGHRQCPECMAVVELGHE